MIRKVVLASLMTVCSTVAIAGSHTWNFNNLSGVNHTGNGAVISVSSGSGMNVQISAWSSSGGNHHPSSCGSQDVLGYNGQVIGSDNDSCIENAKIRSYSSGLGVINRDETDNEPNHAIDNTQDNNHANTIDDIDFDMVLFTFESAVKLTDFSQGYQYTDADASVLAYTGASAFSTNSFFNNSWQDILSDGWSVVDNLSTGEGHPHRDFAVDDTNVFSKHWLVGAYNNVFGEHWSSANDAFKLAGLTVVKKPNDPTGGGNAVNAPATASILFGLLAFMAYRRRS